jgi:Fic family protein
MKAVKCLTDARVAMPFDDAEYRRALQRIRAEYLEMPGMKLTAPQVQRLAGVNALMCARVLEELVMEGMLRRAIDGTFGRSSDTAAIRPRG